MKKVKMIWVLVGIVFIVTLLGCASHTKVSGPSDKSTGELTREEVLKKLTKMNQDIKPIIAKLSRGGEKFEKGKRLLKEGWTLFEASQFKEAKNKWEQALGIFRGLDDQQLVSAALGSLGTVYRALGNYHRAVDYFNQAMSIAKKLNDELSKGTWLGELAIVYDIVGDYQKAIDHYERALNIAIKIENKEGEYAQLGNLGNAYFGLGDYRKALVYHEQVLAIVRNIKDRKNEGIVLGNMGATYKLLGDYSRAIDYLEQALAIAKEIENKDDEGGCLANLGIVYADLDNPRKAIHYLEQAIAIKKAIGIPCKTEEGFLGDAHLVLGEDDKALKLYQKEVQVSKHEIRKAFTPNELTAIEGYMKTVVLLRKSGMPGAGEKYKEMLAGFEKKGFTYNEKTSQLELINVEQKYSVRLGYYYLKQKDFQKARQQFAGKLEKVLTRRDAGLMVSSWIGMGLSCEGLKEYEQAKSHYKKAVEFIEHQRNSLPEATRTHFLAAKVFNFPRIEAYEGLARVSAKLGQTKEAFFWAENTRTRLLAEQIAGKHKAGSFQIPSGLAKKELELINKIASNYKQQEIAFQKDNKEVLKHLEQELKPLKQEQQELIDRLRQEYPRYAAIRYPQPIQAKHVPLKPNEVIIEYEVTEPYTLCMVLRNGKVEKTTTIPKTRQELEQMIKQFRQPFEPGHGLGKFDNRLGKELYDLLLKDALAVIPQGSRLIIVPDEVLSLVPFEALAVHLAEEKSESVMIMAKADTKRGVGGLASSQQLANAAAAGITYLGDRYPVSYYQSATVLSLNRKLQRPRTPAKQLFALGDAIYGKQDTRVGTLLAMRGTTDDRGILISSLDLAHEFGEKELGYRFPRLENTHREVESVGRLFLKHTLLLGTDASEEKIKSLPLKQYRYMLFSTHGILGNNLPYIKEPALVLNLVGNQKEDGFLTMSEIFNLRLDADLVTLSACQTGLGTQVAGEGLMGLSRAFMYAGTDTVIATLWSVADESTSKFMVKFFEGVKSGKDKLTALREAKLYLRNNGYAHPFYWAPFILIGE